MTAQDRIATLEKALQYFAEKADEVERLNAIIKKHNPGDSGYKSFNVDTRYLFLARKALRSAK